MIWFTFVITSNQTTMNRLANKIRLPLLAIRLNKGVKKSQENMLLPCSPIMRHSHKWLLPSFHMPAVTRQRQILVIGLSRQLPFSLRFIAYTSHDKCPLSHMRAPPFYGQASLMARVILACPCQSVMPPTNGAWKEKCRYNKSFQSVNVSTKFNEQDHSFLPPAKTWNALLRNEYRAIYCTPLAVEHQQGRFYITPLQYS